MRYQLSFGQLPAKKPPVSASDGRFRLAILADLSGRASRGEVRVGEQLAAAPGRRVDVDNLEERLEQAQLVLRLQLGHEDESCVEVPIRTMDDFHPDDLVDNLEFFSELSGLRRRLSNPSTFEKAAQEVLSWATNSPAASPPSRRSASTAVPRGKFADFSQLLHRQGRPAPEIAGADTLIRSVVAPFVVPAADPRQEELVAAVDQALAAALRQILHHPDFQAAESTWRGIDLLTRRLETGPELEIVLHDISAEELAADLSSTSDLTQTGLYELLAVQPSLDAAQGSYSAIVANYSFEQTPPHADLLARCAQIAAAAGSPLLAGLSIESIERQLAKENELCQTAWDGLCGLPETAYLGLVAPRFLLRWPYGKKTEPIDPFDFEEFTPQTGLRGMLWGNGAILAGLLLGQTFLQNEQISAMTLGDVLTVDDLPYYYYTDPHGDVIALPCGERLVSEAQAQQISASGCMPLLSIKNCPEVRLAGFRGVNGDSLAGPWAPVTIEPRSVASEPLPSAPSDQVDEDPSEPEAKDAVDEPPSKTSGDVDDGVAEADTDEPVVEKETTPEGSSVAETPAAEASQQSSDGDVDDELDALLATLEADDSPAADDEMDPELAKLLEGL